MDNISFDLINDISKTVCIYEPIIIKWMRDQF